MKANEWMIDADGSIYYFRSWGGAYKSCNVVINGRNYTFGADSKMQGSQWIVKGGKWYLAKEGKIATGWQEWQGSKYYLNSDGTMRSNEWRLDDSGKIRYLCSWGGAYKNRSANINGRSYTFNSNADVTNTQWIAMDGTWKLAKDGRIATGWQTWDKNLYYLNSDGTMKANEAFTDGGKLYFFRSWGGAYKNCWYTSNGKKYYLHDNSAAYQNEWLKADGKWYYFQSDSTMATNTWIDNYYVDASGVWIPNKEKPTDKWITSGNRKWYRHADGSYTKNDWELINGKYYRFDNDGWMVTGWLKIGSTWYYLNPSGERAYDQWVGTPKAIGSCYISKYGKAVTGTTYSLGDYIYTFDANGYCTKKENRYSYATDSKNGKTYKVEKQYDTDASNMSENDFLAAAVYAESANQGLTGMTGVAMVMLNRMANAAYPSDARIMIYQASQFEVARDGALTKAIAKLNSSETAMQNAKEAVRKAREIRAAYQKDGTVTPIEGLNVPAGHTIFEYLGFMTPAAFQSSNLDPVKTAMFTYKNTAFYTSWIKKS